MDHCIHTDASTKGQRSRFILQPPISQTFSLFNFLLQYIRLKKYWLQKKQTTQNWKQVNLRELYRRLTHTWQRRRALKNRQDRKSQIFDSGAHNFNFALDFQNGSFSAPSFTFLDENFPKDKKKIFPKFSDSPKLFPLPSPPRNRWCVWSAALNLQRAVVLTLVVNSPVTTV